MWATHKEKMGRKVEGGNWMSVECTLPFEQQQHQRGLLV